jgi:hypothetical protein
MFMDQTDVQHNIIVVLRLVVPRPAVHRLYVLPVVELGHVIASVQAQATAAVFLVGQLRLPVLVHVIAVATQVADRVNAIVTNINP